MDEAKTCERCGTLYQDEVEDDNDLCDDCEWKLRYDKRYIAEHLGAAIERLGDER